MEKDHRKIGAAILLLSTALFVFFLVRSRINPAHPEGAVPSAVVVEVKGDISKPGIYTLQSTTATVAMAVATAGCSCDVPSAVASRQLITGQSLDIVREGKGIAIRFGRMPGAALLACGLKLDLNSASLEELLLIPQMRSEIASSIVERRRVKAWEQVDDLIEIRGAGPKTVQKLQNCLEISNLNRQ
jgi:DNA uptake protein ComE-like DNA-binding protein